MIHIYLYQNDCRNQKTEHPVLFVTDRVISVAAWHFLANNSSSEKSIFSNTETSYEFMLFSPRYSLQSTSRNEKESQVTLTFFN